MKLYHLSAHPLGESIILRPRIPRDCAPFEDRRIPRICVAPTIRGCLLALQGCYYNTGQWWRYILAEDEQAAEPHRVPDARLTGEMWLLKPARFIHDA